MRALSALLAMAAVSSSLGCGGESASQRCSALAGEYAAALPAARACLMRETCSAIRPAAFDGGLGCWTLVTDAGAVALDEILGRFDAAGCRVVPLPCPAPPQPAACTQEAVCP
jgi:hypothetical protein